MVGEKHHVVCTDRISSHLDFLFPTSDLPLELLHESDEAHGLRGGGCVNRVILKLTATLEGYAREKRDKKDDSLKRQHLNTCNYIVCMSSVSN